MGVGLTIVDSLDTLYIMGLSDGNMFYKGNVFFSDFMPNKHFHCKEVFSVAVVCVNI